MKLFDLFKSQTTTNVAVEERVNLKGKTTNEIIEEIHESFYSEVDKLLASAKIANSLETDKRDLIEKCRRLKELGFTSTKEVKEAEIEIARLNALEAENASKETLIEAINYFSFKYPNYKFITEDSVKKICAKYNLVYGAISRYTGTVPDKNLKHIEDFRVLEEDECFLHGYRLGLFRERDSLSIVSHEEYKKYTSRDSDELMRLHALYYGEINMKAPLEIAAPIKDFNMEGHEVKGFKISKIEIPDPVVLKPIIFKGQKHYLIVTAWGIEAGDELVVNPIHN
jgi:hypothetical protein